MNKEKIKSSTILRINYPNIKIAGLLCIWVWVIKNANLFSKYDVIHCHDVFIWLLPLKVIHPHKKIFLTFHGYESYPIRVVSKIIHKLSSYLSSGTIAVGKFIDKWYGTKSTITTYGAVANEYFKLSDKRKIKYDYVFIGRLDEQTSVKQYLNESIKDKIVFVGDGIYRNICKEYGRVTGFVRNPISYYHKGKVVLTSRYLAILESLALNKPIYAIYDNPIKKDYLILSPFAKWIKIGKTFDNYSSYELPPEARKWIKKQTWSAMADNYYNIWSK